LVPFIGLATLHALGEEEAKISPSSRRVHGKTPKAALLEIVHKSVLIHPIAGEIKSPIREHQRLRGRAPVADRWAGAQSSYEVIWGRPLVAERRECRIFRSDARLETI
jgi:hypothetical protein